MSTTGHTKRRVNLFSLSSTTTDGAGPYNEVFASLSKKAPFETKATFGRKIRVNHVEKFGDIWFIELYLILDRLEVLEVSADPIEDDQPSFVVPAFEKSFATRTCGIFHPENKTCAIEYLRSGPKMLDFMDILSEECVAVTGMQGAQFALMPIIEENFLKEIDHFERIRQVRVIFQRPNPGWADIGILSGELEGSGDAKREVVLTAPRSGTIQKNKGLVKYIKSVITSGASSVYNVVISGNRPGDAGETQVSSEKSAAKHIASLPVTDEEPVYRRSFIASAAPFLRPKGPPGS